MYYAYSQYNEYGVIDPHYFIETMWPNYKPYDKQHDIIESFEYNSVTVVPSANKMGKDWIASLCGLSMFLRHPTCRIITTSIRDDHLSVLWSEMGAHVENCRFPLKTPRGCLKIKHREIRKIVNGKECPISYVKGLVSERPEGFAGHHAPWTAAILDECSGIDDRVIEQILTWSKRTLMIGNPNECQNAFKRYVKEGDMLSPV